MTDEEKIKQELENKFADLKDAVVIKRQSRIFAAVPLEKFAPVFDYAVKNLGFDGLCAITGLDSGENFSVIYHLNREGRLTLNLTVALDYEHPQVATVTNYFPGADIYEREMVDLLGIKVMGLAAGQHYPLPDNWPPEQHPLRKDWHKETKHA